MGRTHDPWTYIGTCGHRFREDETVVLIGLLRVFSRKTTLRDRPTAPLRLMFWRLQRAQAVPGEALCGREAVLSVAVDVGEAHRRKVRDIVLLDGVSSAQ